MLDLLNPLGNLATHALDNVTAADASGNLISVTTINLEASYDDHFKLSLKEIPGTEKTYPCELMIVAAGFLGPDPKLAEEFGLKTTERSNFATENYKTNEDKIFACGDCRSGQSLVVKAMVDGRECAKAVSEFLA